MISNDRLNHIIGVARLMKEECIKNGCEENYVKEMFTLGYLHDIGYEFGDNADHNFIGGDFLELQNYKYANEIRFHGVPNCKYQSKELDLLNWADLHINGKGEYVTFDERMSDIAIRRGKESTAYINAEIVLNSLIEKGFH